MVDRSLEPILVCARFASESGRGENHIRRVLPLGAAFKKPRRNVRLAFCVLEPGRSERSLALPRFPGTSRSGARAGMDHRDRFAGWDGGSTAEILLLCVRPAALSPRPARIAHLDSPSLRAGFYNFGDRPAYPFFFPLWGLLDAAPVEAGQAVGGQQRLHLARSPAPALPRRDLFLFRIR